MYSWNDILIIGDSFCAQRSTYDHWPKLLYSELTNDDYNEPRGKGYPGHSWWTVRKALIDELEISIPKILIIIHTEYSRLMNDQYLPVTFTGASHIIKNLKKYKKYEFYLAATKYYKHLYSKNFNIWAQCEWFKELDSILENKKIEKIIHIFIDYEPYTFYRFKNGLTLSDKLKRYLTINFNSTIYANHMTPQNNQKLAFSLIDIINNNYINGEIYKKPLMEK